jgi:FkbM family methyltransferase
MQYVAALTLLGHERPASGAARPEHPSFQGAWNARLDDWSGTYSAFSRVPGASLLLPGLDGAAELTLLCAPWSGVIELRAGGERVEFDTYAPEHVLRSVALPGQGRRDVQLTLLERRNPASRDSELWLQRLAVHRHQRWLERATRLSPTLEVSNGDFGTFVTIKADIGISHAIRTFGAWGPEQVALFERLVRPGQTVLDVGANIGHHSVVLSSLVGAAGTVLAFEPQPFVHRVLESNLLLNGCSNATAHRMALGAQEGTALMAPMDYEADQWNVGGLGLVGTGHASSAGRPAMEVRVATLDAVVGDRHVDFIKCDAQGYDFEVVKGALQTLRRCRPIVLLEIAPLSMPGGPEVYREMYALLQGLGYRLVDPLAPNPADPPRQWSGVPEEWDILAVPEAQLGLLAA